MKLINDVTAQCIRDWNTRSVGENEQVVRALLDGMTTILQQFKHDDDLNGMTVNSETRFETRSNYHFTLLQGILAKSVIDERETCELIAWMCHRGAGSAQPLHKYIGRHKPNETVAWTRALLARLFAGTSQPTQCDGGVEVWIRSVTYGLQRTLFEFPHLPVPVVIADVFVGKLLRCDNASVQLRKGPAMRKVTLRQVVHTFLNKHINTQQPDTGRRKIAELKRTSSLSHFFCR
jgi:hypothetical protein